MRRATGYGTRVSGIPAEQVVNLLRQIEVAVANGKTTAQACKDAEIVEQTYFRWRKEYEAGCRWTRLEVLRLKELEQGEREAEASWVANLSLDNLVLKATSPRENVWSAPFLQAQECF